MHKIRRVLSIQAPITLWTHTTHTNALTHSTFHRQHAQTHESAIHPFQPIHSFVLTINMHPPRHAIQHECTLLRTNRVIATYVYVLLDIAGRAVMLFRRATSPKTHRKITYTENERRKWNDDRTASARFFAVCRSKARTVLNWPGDRHLCLAYQSNRSCLCGGWSGCSDIELLLRNLLVSCISDANCTGENRSFCGAKHNMKGTRTRT